MKTYKAIEAEIAKLQKQAEALRKGKVAAVIAQVKKAIAEYDLTASDLGLGRGATKRAAAKPKSPQRATSRGRAPLIEANSVF